jgi:hypothetical protein
MWIYVSSQEREGVDIYKIPLRGGDPKLITKAPMIIGNAKESEDGRLYYAKGDEKAEIRVVSSNGGEDHALAGMPTLSGMTDWALGKEGIFLLDRGAGPATIKLFELGTKKIRQIAKLPKPPRMSGEGSVFRRTESGWLTRKWMTRRPTLCWWKIFIEETAE